MLKKEFVDMMRNDEELQELRRKYIRLLDSLKTYHSVSEQSTLMKSGKSS